MGDRQRVPVKIGVGGPRVGWVDVTTTAGGDVIIDGVIDGVIDDVPGVSIRPMAVTVDRVAEVLRAHEPWPECHYGSPTLSCSCGHEHDYSEHVLEVLRHG